MAATARVPPTFIGVELLIVPLVLFPLLFMEHVRLLTVILAPGPVRIKLFGNVTVKFFEFSPVIRKAAGDPGSDVSRTAPPVADLAPVCGFIVTVPALSLATIFPKLRVVVSESFTIEMPAMIVPFPVASIAFALGMVKAANPRMAKLVSAYIFRVFIIPPRCVVFMQKNFTFLSTTIVYMVRLN